MLILLRASSEIPVRPLINGRFTVPLGFEGSIRLYTANLTVLTIIMCFGALITVRMARALWVSRLQYSISEPITVWRLTLFLAGFAATLRCGVDALILWASNSLDSQAPISVLIVKRWIDPVASLVLASWMILVTVIDKSMTYKLTNYTFPFRLSAYMPNLTRPLFMIILALMAVIGVMVTR